MSPGCSREGVDRITKKIGEEATEVVIAAKNADHDELVHEVADLWFHTYVLLAQQGLHSGRDLVRAALPPRRASLKLVQGVGRSSPSRLSSSFIDAMATSICSRSG